MRANIDFLTIGKVCRKYGLNLAESVVIELCRISKDADSHSTETYHSASQSSATLCLMRCFNRDGFLHNLASSSII